jgi:hypothetical protein
VTSLCGDKLIVGGYNAFAGGVFQKLFTGLPPHAQVNILFTLYIIGKIKNS